MVSRYTTALALIAFTRLAHAQGNFHSVPTGGRSALMGNTGTANGTDGAAPFLNPATLMKTDWLLSVSVNIVGGEYTTVHRFRAPDGIDTSRYGPISLQNTSISKMGFDMRPTTVCLFMDGPRIGHATTDVGRTRFGLCFGSLQFDRFDYAGHGYTTEGPRITSAVQSVMRGWQRFIFAPTLAFHVTNDVAIGASLSNIFTTASNLTSMSAISYGSGASTTSWSSHALDANAFGMSPTIGMTARFSPWTLGLAVQAPDFTIYGESHQSQSFATDITSSYAGDGGFRPQAPWRFSAGMARGWQWGSAELDVDVEVPQDNAAAITTTGTHTIATNSVVIAEPGTRALTDPPSGAIHFGLGAEWYVEPRISLLGGTSMTFTLNQAMGGILPTRQSRAAISLGIGSHGRGGSLLAGAEVSYEIGHTLATNGFVSPPRIETVPMEGLRILFVLSGNTSLQTIARGVRDIVK